MEILAIWKESNSKRYLTAFLYSLDKRPFQVCHPLPDQDLVDSVALFLTTEIPEYTKVSWRIMLPETALLSTKLT